MRRFIARLWGRFEDRASAPPNFDCAPRPVDESTPDAPATAYQPDLAGFDLRSDFGAILRANVPPELKRLALRRAWASDPAIASFKGFADYDWDTNAAGYGWLRPADAAMAAATVLGQAERRPEVEDIVFVEMEVDAGELDEAEASVDQPHEEEPPVTRSSA